MDLQDVKNLTIPEGSVKTIHDKDGRLLWGAVAYDTKYEGNTAQDGTPTPDAPQTVNVATGEQSVLVHGKNLFNNYQTPYRTGANFYNLNVGVQIVAGSSQSVTTTATNNSVRMVSTGNWQGVFMLADIEDTKKYTFAAVATGTGLRLSAYTLDDTHTIVRKLAIGSTPDATFGASFTAGSTEKYFAFAFGSSVASTITVSKPQLELGSTATAYEPYQGATYTVDLGAIELCKIGTYQDYIYKSGSDWYVHKAFAKLELDGSENWMVANTTSSRYPFGTDISGVPGELKGAAISDTYIYDIASAETTGADANKFTFRGRWAGDRFYFMTPKTAVSGSTAEEIVSSFKTFLSGHPTKVYFTPTTATDTKITDATLVGQLNAVHEWLTRYGYYDTVSGNLPIIVDRTNL